MKKKYPGLTTTRIVVECQQMLANSVVKMNAKTKVQDWKEEEVQVEMGLDNMTLSDTPIEP